MATRNNKRSKQSMRDNRLANPTQIPRPRFRGPRISFNGTTIKGKFLSASAVSAANVAFASFPIDTSSASLFGPNVASICTAYSEYYATQVTMRFLPNIGPASTDAGGRAYITYIDNPENIASTIAGTVAAAGTAIKATQNFQSFNLWEPFTYRVPLTRRKKVFNCNSVINYGAVEVVERSVQGWVAVFYETPSAAVTVGQWQIESSVNVQGLVNIAT